jgi:hypothetical protein
VRRTAFPRSRVFSGHKDIQVQVRVAESP